MIDEEPRLELGLGEEEDFDPDDWEEIYRIDDDFKTYVGRAKLIGVDGVRGRQARFAEHTTAARSFDGSRLLGEAIRMKGEDKFRVDLIEVVRIDHAAEREIFWINMLGTQHPLGYNLMGGEGNRYRHHEESKNLIKQCLRSYGRDGLKRPHLSVQKITHRNCRGYRGYYKGTPKGFFSSAFSMEEKKTMAMMWHLHGECEFELTLPRARVHLDPNDQRLPTGVKFVPYKISNPYRAYHSQRQHELKSPFFKTLEEAKNYSDLLRSFDNSETPSEYFAIKRNPDDEKDPYLIDIKPKRHPTGTEIIECGAVYGYEVMVPASKSISGNAERDSFMKVIFSVDQNLSDAISFRQEVMRSEFIPAEPEWIQDLPEPHRGPDMTYIWIKRHPTIDKINGYELNIPAKDSKDNKAFYQVCSNTNPTLEENLESILCFRFQNIKAGIIRDDPLQLSYSIHPVYLQEKHKYMTGYKSPGTKKVKKGTLLGWDVDVPHDKSVSGKRERLNFRKKSLMQNLIEARQFRSAKCLKQYLPND